MPDLIAVHWEAAPPRGDHSRCAAQVEDIRRYHKSTGYSDIAYNFLVCNHGQVFVGRGWNRSAATCNTYWNDRAWSVCWMGGPGFSPTQAALGGIRSVIDESFRHGARGVIGHRDACSTQCPGDDLYNWVHSGYIAGPITVPEEDDLPYSQEALNWIIVDAIRTALATNVEVQQTFETLVVEALKTPVGQQAIRDAVGP